MTTYVYRFLNDQDEIIYVGKTKNNVKKRLNAHFTSGHINKVKLSEIKSVQYTTFKNKLEMDIAEVYLINLWEPKINTISKHGEIINIHPFDVNELEWTDIEGNELLKIMNKESDEYQKTLQEQDNELLSYMINECYNGNMFDYRELYSEYDYVESVLKEGFFLKPEEINADKMLWLLDLIAKHNRNETCKSKNINGELIESCAVHR